MLHYSVINELFDIIAEKEHERDDLLDELKYLNQGNPAPSSDFKDLQGRIVELDLEIEIIRERINLLKEEQLKHPNYKEYFGKEQSLEEHATSVSPIRQNDNQSGH